MARRWHAGLFHCYDNAELPRTNNALEQLFGSYRYHERHTTGRKAASPATVLRGAVRLLAATATRGCLITARELARANRQGWRELREQLERHRRARVERTRLRRNPEHYLTELEQLADQLTLPSWFFWHEPCQKRACRPQGTVEASVAADGRGDSMALRTLLYRYFFFGWLFRDASTGTALERAAAWRHNRHQARWLPTYMRRWMCCGLLFYLVGLFVECVIGAPLLSTLFYVTGLMSVPGNAVMAAAWIGFKALSGPF